MTCQQMDELLPLYAGRDLDEKLAGLIEAHLQTCLACARIADEYGKAFQLTQKLTPPIFAADVYAGIRRSVLREIEADAANRSLPQFVVNWFTPRFAWAVAAAVLIAVSASAVYFVVNRGNGVAGDRQVVKTTEPDRRDQSARPGKSSDVPSATDSGNEKQKLAVHRSERKRSPNPITNRANDLVAVSSKSNASGGSPATDNLAAPTLSLSGDAATSEKTLRMEIQTRDPNIRIIWFAQQETKPAVPASKGT